MRIDHPLSAAALLFAFLVSPGVYAGQPPAAPPDPNRSLHSPEVHPDGKVTFRLYAPDAHSVLLQAEGREATPGITPDQLNTNSHGTPMTKDANGVWTVDFGPIQPGAYRYSFTVDGVATTDPRNPDSSQTLTSVRSLYEVPGAPWQQYVPDVPHGAIATVWYSSSVVNGLRRMHIYTPPGYESSRDSRYPVLYLLHGGGDSDDSWPTVGRAGAILDNLIAAGQTVPMIVVMPAGHISRDFQLSSGMNSMGRDGFNNDLTGSVVPFIDRNYRTLADRDHRALAGLSMGGLQALNVSLTNSPLFSWVGIFSSGWFSTMRPAAEKDLAAYQSSGKPFRLYWVGVGQYDIANANSADTVALLRKYGISPVTHDSPGFHAWNNWRDYLRLFAPQLFQPKPQ